MSQTVGMIAYRDFEYAGTIRFKGDRFDVDPVTATILVHSHDARLTTPEDGPPPCDETPVETKKEITPQSQKPKRTRTPRPGGNKKRRRDIVRAPVTK